MSDLGLLTTLKERAMLKPQRTEQDSRIIKAVVLICRGKEGGDAYAKLKLGSPPRAAGGSFYFDSPIDSTVRR